MSINEVSTFYIIKEDTIAMGGAQIMLGLIHNALGTLWLSLHNLEDKRYSIGHKLMLASICYLFVSGTFIFLQRIYLWKHCKKQQLPGKRCV
uniref:Membrane-spanning 4-domains, subfamily A, member 20 n=1 Tax=Mus musculus TaxID=10090 RepID=A0A9L6KDS7_MOUSE